MTLSPQNQDAIAVFQQGSYVAVKELFDEHYTVLIDFATQLILNKSEAHHIVQETFIKLFQMRDRFNREADIKAFLFITVRNICFAYIRSENKKGSDQDVTWYQQSLKTTARYDAETLRNQALDDMQRQVQALPETEQRVFALLFCDQLTIPAVAGQLALTPVTVTQLRIKAIALLRENLIAADLFSIPLFIYFVAVYSGL
ncbi:hypothetical protein A3860_30720 [Niastella vici]|uniref:RNA polymerase sigma-70 region 2 domain-containing protein n=2 Tax=Niastella vici TaxID=1703345 RepID=A0A1V9FU21_9BACT|nr:hypothetical protein A3860_30720 [Niastella vici]